MFHGAITTDEFKLVTGTGVTESLPVYQIPVILEKFNGNIADEMLWQEIWVYCAF